MAGIGFELKKIFKEKSVTSMIKGIGFSTLITIGPTVIVIVTIIALYRLMGYLSIPYFQRELLSSTILYVFVFSLVLTSPLNAVLSRYIADKMYDEKIEDILPSYYCGLLINTLVGALIGIPFAIHLVAVGGVAPIFAFVSYCFFIILILVFLSITYLVATKDYKIIALFFFIGMLTTFISTPIFRNIFHTEIIDAILYGITLGFFVISFLEFSYIRKYFSVNSGNYRECLGYVFKFKSLFLCNLFYTLGLYVHNFIFWTTPMRMIVAKSYYTMQAYDMACFLGMFSNISMIVIFTVAVETKFHDKYQVFNEAVIGAPLKDIEVAKKSMFRLLMQQISYVVRIQLIITSIIFLIAITFLPKIGFGGMVMSIYPSLAAAFFAIFIMYCNIIFLFYFDDGRGAMWTSIIFFASVFIGTIISKEMLPIHYGLGTFIGAIIGWTFSFFRIQYMEKHFDKHIFCQGNILEQKAQELPNSLVYKREDNSTKG